MQKSSTEIVNGPTTNEKYVTELFDVFLVLLFIFTYSEWELAYRRTRLFIYFIYLFADNNNHAVAHNNSE